MGKANKYKYRPYDANRKIFCKDTGEHCRGDTYLNSKHWKNMRKQAYEHYKGVCQRCGTVVPLNLANVHHRTYKRFGNENVTDLVLYCNRCHTIIHHNKDRIKSGRKNINTFINQLSPQEKAEALLVLRKHFNCDEDDVPTTSNIECDPNEPTIKQITFASSISKTLKIALPSEYSRKAYYRYINNNINAFRAIGSQ